MSSSTLTCRAVAAVGVLALALTGCGLQPSGRLAKPIGPALSQAIEGDYQLVAPTAAPAARPAPAAEPSLGVITIYAVDMHFVPKLTSIARPGRYTVRLVNTDELPHDITLPDGTRIYANPGETAEGAFTIGAAGVSFICAVPGHREAGMVGQINVESTVVAGNTP